MKKQILSYAAAVIIMSLMTACTQTDRKNTGMVAGGVIGGMAGSALTDGSTAGTIAGAVGGGYVGRELTN